jgi:hypothetical protein
MLIDCATAAAGARIRKLPMSASPIVSEDLPVPRIVVSPRGTASGPDLCAIVPDQSLLSNQSARALPASCQGIDRKSNQPEISHRAGIERRDR